MKITEDFIGNETKELTKTKIASILRWWGFNPDSYSTWGNARVDMNNILSVSSSSTISDRERASSFLSKINYINDPDTVISDTLFAADEPGVWFDPSDLSTLYQDSVGTIPVTGGEQPVGLMLDKSRSLGPNLAPSTGSLSGWTINQTGGSVTVVDGGLFLNTTGTGTVAASFGGLTSSARYLFEFEVVSVSGLMYLEYGAGGVAKLLVPGKHRWCVTGRTTFYLRNTGAAATSGSLLIKNVVVRAAPGSHAVQATTTARPILSARYNLLGNTPWEGAVVGAAETCLPPTGWVKGFWTSGSIDAITDVNGDKALTFTATSGRIQFSQALSVKENDVLVSRVDVLATSGLQANAILEFTGSGTRQFFFNDSPISNNTLISQPGQLSCTFVVSVGTTSVSPRFGIGTNAAASGTVTICRPDFRLAADVPNLPAYQRVVSSSEYQTEGFPYYLRFDGVDDHLNIGVLNMSAASTVGYFSAITKLSDVSAGRWYSHSLTTSPGSVRLLAPANPGQASVRVGFYSSSGLKEVGGTAHAAPITLTVRTEIEPGGDGLWITHNNGAKISSAVDPTVFSADGEACIGAQVATSFRTQFLNGRLYSLIVTGKKSNISEHGFIESFLRQKSKAY